MEIKLHIPNDEKGLRTVHVVKWQIPQGYVDMANGEVLNVELILFRAHIAKLVRVQRLQDGLLGCR